VSSFESALLPLRQIQHSRAIGVDAGICSGATMSLHTESHTKQTPWRARAGHSVKRTAELLDLSTRGVYRKLAAREIRAKKLGGKWVIPTKEINRLIGEGR
jgi:excisionase family DNA binding protein